MQCTGEGRWRADYRLHCNTILYITMHNDAVYDAVKEGGVIQNLQFIGEGGVVQNITMQCTLQ